MKLSRRALLGAGAAALAGCVRGRDLPTTTSTETQTKRTRKQSMADTVLIQNDDVPSGNQWGDVTGRSNTTDYVESGLGFTPDYTNNELSISSGKAFIQDSNGRDATLLPDSRGTLSLTDSATNHVYLSYDPADPNDPTTNDDITYDVNTSDTAPSDPSLKIGTVDTANDTFDDTINRDPDATFATADAEQATVGELNREVDAKKWMDQEGLADIAAAVNDAASYLKSTYSRGGRITIPTGEWTINEQIDLPDLSAPGGGPESPGSFEVVGQGQRATKLIPGSSFPSSDYMIVSNATSDKNFGYRAADLFLEDDNSRIGSGGGGIRFANTSQSLIENVFVEVPGGNDAIKIEGGGNAIKNKLDHVSIFGAENDALHIDVAGGPTYLTAVDLDADHTVSGSTALNYVSGERLMGDISIEGGDVGMRLEGDEASLSTRFELGGKTNTTVDFIGDANEVTPRSKDADQIFVNARNVGVHNRIRDPAMFRVKPIINPDLHSSAQPPEQLANVATGSGSVSNVAAGQRLSTGATAGSTSPLQISGFNLFNETWYHGLVNNLTDTDVIVRIRLEEDSSNYAGLLFDTTSGTSSSNWLFDAQTGGAAPPGGSPVDTGVAANSSRYLFSICHYYDVDAAENRVGIGIYGEFDDSRASHEFDVQLGPHKPLIEIDNTPSSGVDKTIDVSQFRVESEI